MFTLKAQFDVDQNDTDIGGKLYEFLDSLPADTALRVQKIGGMLRLSADIQIESKSMDKIGAVIQESRSISARP